MLFQNSKPSGEARDARPSLERFLCVKDWVIEYRGLISAGQILQSSICKCSFLFSKAVWCKYVYPCCLLFLKICTYVLGKPAVPADTQSACEPRDVSNECSTSWLFIIPHGKNQAKLFSLLGKQKHKGLYFPYYT